MSTYNGHVTRLSDSSSYDEICVNCGATDERGSDALYRQCPKPVSNGGITQEEYRKQDTERIQRLQEQLNK